MGTAGLALDLSRQHQLRHRKERQLLLTGLDQLGELLSQKPLIAMGFRFRRSARLGLAG